MSAGMESGRSQVAVVRHPPWSLQQQRGLILICALLGWCIALVGYRVHRTGSDGFLFLVWNLFLACIPLFVSRLLQVAHRRQVPDIAQLGLLALWLLFLPNAPYILTDLVHLQPDNSNLYWYDLAMVLSYAGTGLLVGYSSLFDVHNILVARFGRALGWSLAAGALVLSGYGVYLGRVQRWNSWDVVTNPRGLFRAIADCLFNPSLHLHTYAVSAVFGVGLLLGYAALHSLIWDREKARQ
jgi:uncharacterized membrane protein